MPDCLCEQGHARIAWCGVCDEMRERCVVDVTHDVFEYDGDYAVEDVALVLAEDDYRHYGAFPFDRVQVVS